MGREIHRQGGKLPAGFAKRLQRVRRLACAMRRDAQVEQDRGAARGSKANSTRR